MKRAAALTALFITGLIAALTLAGGGLSWYSTSTQTETTGTTETTQTTETTVTELCPNGNPNTGGKDGHPGNDSCQPDETTETGSGFSQTPLATSPPPPSTTTQETTTEATATETTPPATEPVPPVSKPPVAHKPPAGTPPKPKPGEKCKAGTRKFHGRCHAVIEGSG